MVLAGVSAYKVGKTLVQWIELLGLIDVAIPVPWLEQRRVGLDVPLTSAVELVGLELTARFAPLFARSVVANGGV